MKSFLRAFPFLAMALFMAACATDDKSIVPIPLRTKIHTIYVVENPKAMAENELLQPEIIGQLSAMGFMPMVVSDASSVSPDDYVLTYSARVSGRTIKTLSYLRVDVKQGKRAVGYAFSDAGGTVDEYGETSARVKSLFDGLFEYVRPRG
jgi:hypothetical protein